MGLLLTARTHVSYFAPCANVIVPFHEHKIIMHSVAPVSSHSASVTGKDFNFFFSCVVLVHIGVSHPAHCILTSLLPCTRPQYTRLQYQHFKTRCLDMSEQIWEHYCEMYRVMSLWTGAALQFGSFRVYARLWYHWAYSRCGTATSQPPDNGNYRLAYISSVNARVCSIQYLLGDLRRQFCDHHYGPTARLFIYISAYSIFTKIEIPDVYVGSS